MRSPSAATSLCQSCPKLSRSVCPVAEADQNESTTPWGKMSVMKRIEEKLLPPTPENFKLAYKCLNCRASQSACELDNPVWSTLDTFRAKAFQLGVAPESVFSYCKHFQKFDNPFGKDLQKILTSHFPPNVFKKEKTAYFPGCVEIARDLKATENAIETLDLPLYSESFQCCGYPLFVAGDHENFREIAEINTHALRDYQTIVSQAPACLYTMQTLYAGLGLKTKTRFLHATEYLAASSLKIKKPAKKRVAYHDPCYLGRYRNVYDEPRQWIEKINGKSPIEFSRNREASFCSGAGGLLPVSSPETAKKITASRVAEFSETKADLLVTGCSTCVQRFRKSGVPTKSLLQYLKDQGKP